MLNELTSLEAAILLWCIAKSTGLMLVSSILFTQRSARIRPDEAGSWVNFNECDGGRGHIVPVAYEGRSSWPSRLPIVIKPRILCVTAADWCGNKACHEASADLSSIAIYCADETIRPHLSGGSINLVDAVTRNLGTGSCCCA